MALTPEQTDALLKLDDRARAVRIKTKIETGKPLTAAERAHLLGAQGPVTSGYVEKWDTLADALGVSRKALQNWRRDPRYKSDCPKDHGADGRKSIEAWLAFMRQHGLKRADESVGASPTDEDPGAVQFPPGSESEWKKKLLEQKVAEAEARVGQLRGELLVAAELEIPLGASYVAIQNKLVTFAERVGPRVAGFTEVHEIIAIMHDEMDADLADLHAAAYLDDVAEVVAALPIATDDTRALVLDAARESLRRIGRRAIAALTRAPTDPLDATTGQVTDVRAGHASEASGNAAAPHDTPAASPGRAAKAARTKAAKPAAPKSAASHRDSPAKPRNPTKKRKPKG